MVKINFDFKKKDLFLISSIFVLLVGAGLIIAYNPGGVGNPAVMGHSANELEGVCLSDGTNCLGGGGGSGFGNWVDVTASASGGSVVGPATTDGFVVIYNLGANFNTKGYTDNNNPPTTLRLAVSNFAFSPGDMSLTMPVIKGDYWIVMNSPGKIYWIPLGGGVGGGGISSCVTRTGTGSETAIVSCVGAEIRTGGGCNSAGGSLAYPLLSYPSGSSSWTCSDRSTTYGALTVYAVCCS